VSATEIKSVNTRLAYWDNIKGVLIILVVIGHYLWAYWDSGNVRQLISFIYLFHMPAFVFVSGYFSKGEKSRSYHSILRLIVIYLVFNSLMMIMNALLTDGSFQFITPYYSFWYLVSLVLWRLTVKYIENIYQVILMSIVLALLIGFWSDVNNVLAISRTIVFYPFFLLGYKLPVEKIQDFVYKRNWFIYMSGAALLAATVYISWLFIKPESSLTQSALLMDGYSDFSGLLVRAGIFYFAALMIVCLVALSPIKHIPILTRLGKNSLAIFVLHRFFTLVFVEIIPPGGFNLAALILALGASFVTAFILGTDCVTDKLNAFTEAIIQAFSPEHRRQKPNPLSKRSISLLVILFLLLPVINAVLIPRDKLSETAATDVIHQVMTNEQRSMIDNSVSIAFVGDLILLQGQIQQAYNAANDRHDFEPMFQYAKKYLTEADYAIGILEGPIAGSAAGYSSSNFDDGLPLFLNYPESFAAAIKDSGIDLVSTANNHLLDQGLEGAMRTLDVLDSMGIEHTGTYRTSDKKNTVKIIEVGGIRIAVLAYTYGSNGYNDDYFLEQYPSLTSILVAPESRYFNDAKNEVTLHLQAIKNMGNPPDLIAVIPHMGTQFSHEVDDFQETWNDIFIEAGADIILGDHAHAVQPIEFHSSHNDEGTENRCVIVNCPGNFANSYTDKNGDATSIVEVYIDPITRDIVGTSIVPMYTHSPSNGINRALPIFDIMSNPALHAEISNFELSRVAEVQHIVTSVMLGVPLTLDQVQDRYYLFPEGYVRQNVTAIEITDAMKSTEFYELLTKNHEVCFIGDSITAGTKNGGYGWFEPLMAAFPDKTIHKNAWGSATTVTLLNRSLEEFHSSPLYVIAIGTNDIRYRNPKTCAMDKENYIQNLDALVHKLQGINGAAEFVLISPWVSLKNDPFTELSMEDREVLRAEYSQALQQYCNQEGFCFIDPNPSIYGTFLKTTGYLLDHIHPNANEGIRLYSTAVITDSNTTASN